MMPIKFSVILNRHTTVLLQKILSEFDVPTKLVRQFRMTKSQYGALIKAQCQLTRPFHTDFGLKQGDGHALILFNIALYG